MYFDNLNCLGMAYHCDGQTDRQTDKQTDFIAFSNKCHTDVLKCALTNI